MSESRKVDARGRDLVKSRKKERGRGNKRPMKSMTWRGGTRRTTAESRAVVGIFFKKKRGKRRVFKQRRRRWVLHLTGGGRPADSQFAGRRTRKSIIKGNGGGRRVIRQRDDLKGRGASGEILSLREVFTQGNRVHTERTKVRKGGKEIN